MRGLASISPAIARGLTIAACEQLRGFGPVMARLRGGEESALAELEFAEALVRSNMSPVLEPRLGSKTLDCSVDIGSERVFAEVTSPETAVDIRDVQAILTRKATDLIEVTKGTRTEILIGEELDSGFDTIFAFAAAAPPDGAVRNVEGSVWIRRDFLGTQPANLGSLIANPDPRPALGVAQMSKDESGLFTSVTVRLPISDERAHRIFSSELSHFSQTERNILAVRVFQVPGGMKWWGPLTLRWFQPSRNRRVGAVVLYERSTVLETRPTIRQRWRIIENPYAYVPIPRSLIETIQLLDESDAEEGG